MISSDTADIDSVDWPTFMRSVFKWKQGEHITLVGPTGGGKTTLVSVLLPLRDYQVIIATKAKDPLIAEWKQSGEYEVVKEFDINADITPKVIIDPGQRQSISATKANQRRVIKHALESVYHQGHWALYIDEGNYVVDDLRLGDDLRMFWHTGRTLKISTLISIQRPAKIPLVAYSGASHLFFWRNNDEADIKRIGGIGGQSNRLIRDTVSSLDWENYEVLYLNTRSGRMVRTKVKVSS